MPNLKTAMDVKTLPSEITDEKLICFHCGEDCPDDSIQLQEKVFCCQGCQTVYSILNQHELSDYYCYSPNPGVKLSESYASKFQFLDDAGISAKLISFSNDTQTQVTFYLPQMHCASCLWLLEHLYRISPYILSSQVNFTEKKVRLAFDHRHISMRQVAELLTSIGYEPHITLQDYEEQKESISYKGGYLKLGIVGFCFANIMLVSFPEYLGLEYAQNKFLAGFLRYINVGLAMPVLIFGAKEFFANAYKGLRQKVVNIDTPIALAITITFLRSMYEIFTQTGPGYLDSMSGIIFFMLIGRSLQNKTFATLKFNRDYKSYFPISVTVLKDGKETIRKIEEVDKDDIIRIHHQEIIPVDGILTGKPTDIDYSFVTGENEITQARTGMLVYAGGKIMGQQAELMVVKPFKQNSFTSLWNNKVFNKNTETTSVTFVEKISNAFSITLLLLAFGSFAYWQWANPANAWNALTGVLIVACPCTLLLASSYTFGFTTQWFSNIGFFVKNASILESLNEINHIVFDKTGTVTEINKQTIHYCPLTALPGDLPLVLSVMQHSSHPLSKAIVQHYKQAATLNVLHVVEHSGAGVEAWLNDQHIKIGKAAFTNQTELKNIPSSCVYFSIDHKRFGYFALSNVVKTGVTDLIPALNKYKMSLLSGDNNRSKQQMEQVFGQQAVLLFEQTPQMKLAYIQQLQEKGERVLMVGDGLNDAGALKQSDVGISMVDDHFTFSPSSDVIMNVKNIAYLDKFLKVSRQVKNLIIGLFVYSLLYNVVGLSVAVSANISPLIAAILMPSSSISVILFSFIGTRYLFNKYFPAH